MGLFDNLLEQVDAADREVFKKYPKIAEEVNRADEYVEKWETWKNDNWDSDSRMTRNAAELIRQRDAEIEALKALQVGDMDWDSMKTQVQQLVKEANYATADDVKKALDTELSSRVMVKQGDKMIPVTEYTQNLERGMEFMYAKSAHLPLKYYQEFGEVISMEDLMTHMREKGIGKFEDAYESFARPLREKKAVEAQTAREEELKKQVREETLKEVTMRQGALPLDDRGQAPEATALQMRINSRKKIEVEGAPKLTPGDLGSWAGAQDAYQAYLRDMASGNKPKTQ